MIRRILAAIVRFIVNDPARAAREAEDISFGIVPPSRRYDRDLVRRMQRAAMFSAPDHNDKPGGRR